MYAKSGGFAASYGIVKSNDGDSDGGPFKYIKKRGRTGPLGEHLNNPIGHISRAIKPL